MKKLGLFVLMCCQFLSSHGFAANRESINWMIMDWPPAYIVDGPSKGQGVFDIGLRLLTDELSEFDHNIVVNPLARTKREAQKGVPLCYYGPIYSQSYADQNRFILSMPISVTPSPQIAILKKNLHLFGSSESVSFEKLLTGGKSQEVLKLGVVSSWKYGKVLDELIEKHGEVGANLIQRPGRDAAVGLVKMLAAGRIHYIPYFSAGFKWLLKSNGYSPDEFMMIPIDEVKDNLSMGAVGCTNSPWGKEKIDHINQALLKVRRNETFYNTLQVWFAPKGQEAAYRKVYEEVMLPKVSGFTPAAIKEK